MNIFNIENAFRLKKERKWNRLYWCVDLHDTVFKGSYARNQKVDFYYPNAMEVLHYLSMHSNENVLIAYTSSYDDVIDNLLEELYEDYGVTFKYVNENPEYNSTDYADFSKKFYFNILLDDKAGFEGEKDWSLVKQELIRLGEWDECR